EQLLRILKPTPPPKEHDDTPSGADTPVRADPGAKEPSDEGSCLHDVLDAFRHPDCGFIAPLGPQSLTTRTVVDIGHEALIRRWDRLNRRDTRQGWLQEEAHDGERYRALIQLLPGPLSANLTPQWLRWWDERPRTAGWAERYGRRFVDVASLLAKSEKRLH